MKINTLEVKLSDEEKRAITDLKRLYLDTVKLDVDLQQEIYALEKAYEKKHNEIFDRRRKLLNCFRDMKKKTPGDNADHNNIKYFWLRVLKASYTEFISKRDEKILMHLVDIRSVLCNEPQVKFSIEFYFEPNEFFHNRVLTKTYYLNTLPDAQDPLSFDGAEICKCEGCILDWKPNEDDKGEKRKGFSSFFDFFNPPAVPDDPDDSAYNDVNAVLQNDFELGFYLKERVIPKAILFFTGEIVDCQSSDSESGDSAEENEGDEEDEEDFGAEEEQD